MLRVKTHEGPEKKKPKTRKNAKKRENKAPKCQKRAKNMERFPENRTKTAKARFLGVTNEAKNAFSFSKLKCR